MKLWQRAKVTMLLKTILAVFSVLIGICNCAFVDTITKCSWTDNVCVKNLIANIIKQHSETGVLELNVPPLDPLELKNVEIPIFGVFNITLDEGQVKGLKGCEIINFYNDVNKGETTTDLSCDIEIKAKFRLDDVSPIVKKLIGQDSNDGSGDVIIKIEKLQMKTKIFFDVAKLDDGEIAFKFRGDHITKFEIGSFHMTVHNIFFGKQDFSKLVESFFNENWKLIMPTFGKGIFDVAMQIVIDILGSFFQRVPAKYYFINDFTGLV